MAKQLKEVYLILHNVRSVYNVGSIFRTADCAGISKIFLTGYTAAPKDRFGNYRKDLAKVALGAEKNILWKSQESISDLIKKLKQENFYIVSVEQSKNSKNYKKFKAKNKTAVIFGNEIKGLSSSVLKTSDIVLEIPMKGKKESLNVSVSAAIVLFRILDI